MMMMMMMMMMVSRSHPLWYGQLMGQNKHITVNMGFPFSDIDSAICRPTECHCLTKKSIGKGHTKTN